MTPMNSIFKYTTGNETPMNSITKYGNVLGGINTPIYTVNGNNKLLYDAEGELHSIMDYPSFINEKGHKFWHKHGERHREGDKPAVITDVFEAYYIDGLLHRDNGPAEVYSDGTKTWYTNGKKIPAPELKVQETEFDTLTKSLSPDEKTSVLNLVKTFVEKIEIEKQGFDNVLKHLDKFSESELKVIVDKNKEMVKDNMYYKFVLGFVLKEYAIYNIHDKIITPFVAGILIGMNKVLLAREFNKRDKLESKVYDIVKEILNSDCFPSKQELVDMIYDKPITFADFLKLYIVTCVNNEKYKKIQYSVPVNLSGLDMELFYMVKDH